MTSLPLCSAGLWYVYEIHDAEGNVFGAGVSTNPIRRLKNWDFDADACRRCGKIYRAGGVPYARIVATHKEHGDARDDANKRIAEIRRQG